MRLLIDCTELAANPVATGIQRVVREFLRGVRHDPGAPRPVRFVIHIGLCTIPPGALELMLAEGGTGSAASVRERADAIAERCGPAEPVNPAGATVIIPEVFYDPIRCAHYHSLLDQGCIRLGMLAFDFLPFTDPGLFRIATAAPLMHYLRLVTRADSVAFISAHTRRQFEERVTRERLRPGQVGPVLPPGADGLGPMRQQWHPGRRLFLCLGTIERRKNQALVAEAFASLWDAGCDAELALCGRVLDNADTGWIEAAQAYPGFTWLQDAPDAVVAGLMARARATLYVSEAEGYGLPPLESLQAGVPVIVHADLPSTAGLFPAGQVRLPSVTAGSIADAVRRLLDDAAAERLWAEAATARLPTWRGFAAGMLGWAHSIPPPRPGVAAA